MHHVEDLAEIPATQAAPDLAGLGRAAWARQRCATAARESAVRADRRPAPLTVRAARVQVRPGQAGLDTLRVECRLTAPLPQGRTVAVDFRAAGDESGPGWREITAQGTVRRSPNRTCRRRPLRPADPLPGGRARVPARRPDRVPACPPRRPRAGGGRDGRGGRARLRAPAPGRRPLDAGPGRPGRPARPDRRVRRARPAARGVPRRDARARAGPRQDPDGRDRGGARRPGADAGRAADGRLRHGHPHPRRARPGPAGHGSAAAPSVVAWLGIASGVLVTLAAPSSYAGRCGSAAAPRIRTPTSTSTPRPRPRAPARPSPPARPRPPAPPRPHPHPHPRRPYPHPHRRAQLRGTVLLGFAGGLVPSPSAVVVLVGAAALGHAWFGLLLVVAYGVGLALTLTAAGYAVVRAGGACRGCSPGARAGRARRGRRWCAGARLSGRRAWCWSWGRIGVQGAASALG